MGQRKRRNWFHEVARAAVGEREHEDKEKMVETIEKSIEPRAQKSPRRLCQAGIQMHH